MSLSTVSLKTRSAAETLAFRTGLGTLLGMYATAFLLLLAALRDSFRVRDRN